LDRRNGAILLSHEEATRIDEQVSMVGVLIGVGELSVPLIHTQGAKQDPASFILDGSIFEVP